MQVVILDYGAGNVRSVQFALERLGIDSVLSNDSETILSADRIIFPGQGEAESAMKKLRQYGLDRLLPELKQPLLGICLGMQLMFDASEEGDTKGLGIIPGQVKRFTQGKIPQVGWNTIEELQGPLFQNIPELSYMYLVHSFYAPLVTETSATSTYGIRYTVAIQTDNFFGVQFHPEKSSKV